MKELVLDNVNKLLSNFGIGKFKEDLKRNS